MRGKHAAKAQRRRTLKAESDYAEHATRQQALRERLSIAEEAQAEALARLTDLTAQLDRYRVRTAPAGAAEDEADAARVRRDEVAAALRRSTRSFYNDFTNYMARRETKSGGLTVETHAGEGIAVDLLTVLEELRSEFGFVARKDRPARNIVSDRTARAEQTS